MPGPSSAIRTWTASRTHRTLTRISASRRRVPPGVLEQVREHLVELDGIHGRRPGASGGSSADHGVLGEPGRIRARTTSTISSIAAGWRVGRERARADPRQVEDVADQPVQAVRLLEDRREQLSLLRRVVVDGGVEEAGHARLDRRERRPQVVGDRREHRGAELVGLGVELCVPRARVQARAVERGGRLAGRRFEQELIVAGERPAAGRPLRDERADGSLARQERHGRSRPGLAICLGSGDGMEVRPVEGRVDLDPRERERLQQHVARTRRAPGRGPRACAGCSRAFRGIAPRAPGARLAPDPRSPGRPAGRRPAPPRGRRRPSRRPPRR